MGATDRTPIAYDFFLEMRVKIFLLLGALTFLSAPAVAATQAVVLSIPKIACAACTTKIRAALTKVRGVKTEMNLERRQAVVSFDDAQTSVQALTKATADAGFPAEVVK